MELRRLRHAVVLARLLNFTKAAESLHLTQSALSRSIQTLESECQLRLFDRDRASVKVTAVGREFIRRAETLLRDETELMTMVNQAAKGEGGEIVIGMPPIASKIILAPLLTGMMDIPNFHVDVVLAGPGKLLAMLVDEKIELCICPSEQMPARAPITGFRLTRYPVEMVVRAGHPLTRLAKVGPKDASEYPLLLPRPRSLENDVPAVVGLLWHKKPTVTVEDYDSLGRIALESDAVWLTAPVAAMERIRDGSLVALPISWLSNQPHVDLMVYQLKRRSLSPLAQTMIARLQRLAAGMDVGP